MSSQKSPVGGLWVPTTTQGSSQEQRGGVPPGEGTSRSSQAHSSPRPPLCSLRMTGKCCPAPLCPRGHPSRAAGVVSRSPPLRGRQQPRIKIHLLGPVPHGYCHCLGGLTAPRRSPSLQEAGGAVPTPAPWSLPSMWYCWPSWTPQKWGTVPQGDVGGLGHGHLKAVKAHLELGRDGVSCGPGC